MKNHSITDTNSGNKRGVRPVLVFVGRPNVGKSTLFNRLTRTRDAIVDDIPGVTRDRLYGDMRAGDTELTLVDTGGFIEGDIDEFAPAIRSQIEEAMEDADAVVLLLDGKSGLSPFDLDLVRMVRCLEKPVFFLVNKIDGLEQEDLMHEFHELGIAPIFPVSAEHGYGVRDFLDQVESFFPIREETENDVSTIDIAVIGRPNVGKSSLVNRILGKERHLVSDIPGTTRDAVDSLVERDGKIYRFIDTAGIRRKGRVSRKIEKFSVVKALKSLDRCDIALILIDAHEGITDQDLTIAGYAFSRGKGCIFLLNKWDLVEKEPGIVKKYSERLRDAAGFLAFAPILTISALTGQRVQKIFQHVNLVYQEYIRRIGTGEVNRIFRNAVERNEPPIHRGKRLKYFYATQVSTRPPTFVCFFNYPGGVHFSYKRYLINRIREDAGLLHTPIRLLLKEKTGRMDFRKKKKRKKRR